MIHKFRKNSKIIILALVLVLFFIISLSLLRFSDKNPDYCTTEDSKTKPSTEEGLKKYYQCQPVIAYFKEETPNDQALSFTENIKKEKGVYLVEFVSGEESVESYKQNNAQYPDLIQMMPSGMIFPSSIRVYITDPEMKTSILQKIQSSPLIQTAI